MDWKSFGAHVFQLVEKMLSEIPPKKALIDIKEALLFRIDGESVIGIKPFSIILG